MIHMRQNGKYIYSKEKVEIKELFLILKTFKKPKFKTNKKKLRKYIKLIDKSGKIVYIK